MRTSDQDAEQPYRLYTAASFGQAIRNYRKQAGLSQEQLADRVGMHRVYISRLEAGGGTQQLQRILVILRELGIKVTLERADW